MAGGHVAARRCARAPRPLRAEGATSRRGSSRTAHPARAVLPGEPMLRDAAKTLAWASCAWGIGGLPVWAVPSAGPKQRLSADSEHEQSCVNGAAMGARLNGAAMGNRVDDGDGFRGSAASRRDSGGHVAGGRCAPAPRASALARGGAPCLEVARRALRALCSREIRCCETSRRLWPELARVGIGGLPVWASPLAGPKQRLSADSEHEHSCVNGAAMGNRVKARHAAPCDRHCDGCGGQRHRATAHADGGRLRRGRWCARGPRAWALARRRAPGLDVARRARCAPRTLYSREIRCCATSTWSSCARDRRPARVGSAIGGAEGKACGRQPNASAPE